MTRRSGSAAAALASASEVQTPLARVLERRVRALDDELLDARRGEVEAVHHARVATRRLREAVPLTLARGRGKRLMRRLRKLTRALGPLRELDVAIASLADRAARRRSPGIGALRAHLDTERKAALARVQDAIDRPRAERLVGRLEKQVRHVDGVRAARVADRARKVLVERTIDRARSLHEAVDVAGAIFIVERIHAVRIEAKRLRYALELVGELHLAPTSRLVAGLKRMQDVLGELHDLDVLRAHATVIRATLGGDSARDLDALSASLEDEARHLHARYLRRARALVLLTDRVRDRMAPCLDPSTSTSSDTPSPKSAATPGRTTPSGRSRRMASRGGGGRPRASSRSTPDPTSS